MRDDAEYLTEKNGADKPSLSGWIKALGIGAAVVAVAVAAYLVTIEIKKSAETPPTKPVTEQPAAR